MVDPERKDRWPRQRIAAAILTLALAAIALHTWRNHGDRNTLILLVLGVGLGVLYCVRGSLPSHVYRRSEGRLTSDDDEHNLPVGVYLPILLIVLALAAAAYYFYGPKR